METLQVIIPIYTNSNNSIGYALGYYLIFMIPILLGMPKFLKSYLDIKNNKVSSDEKESVIYVIGKFDTLSLLYYRCLDSNFLDFLIGMAYSKGGLIFSAIGTLIIIILSVC